MLYVCAAKQHFDFIEESAAKLGRVVELEDLCGCKIDCIPTASATTEDIVKFVHAIAVRIGPEPCPHETSGG